MRLHVIIVQISTDFGRSIFILISDNPRFYIQNSCYEHNIPTRTELSQWRKCSFSHYEILNNHHLLGKGKSRKNMKSMFMNCSISKEEIGPQQMCLTLKENITRQYRILNVPHY